MTAIAAAVAPATVSHGLLLDSGFIPTPFPETGDEKDRPHEDPKCSPFTSCRELPLQWYVARL